jgi:hypothetical protein
MYDAGAVIQHIARGCDLPFDIVRIVNVIIGIGDIFKIIVFNQTLGVKPRPDTIKIAGQL